VLYIQLTTTIQLIQYEYLYFMLKSNAYKVKLINVLILGTAPIGYWITFNNLNRSYHPENVDRGIFTNRYSVLNNIMLNICNMVIFLLKIYYFTYFSAHFIIIAIQHKYYIIFR